MRQARLSDAFNDTWNGPGIVSTPAFPYSPDGGAANANVLKYGLSPPVTGRPVASARGEPTTALPAILARLPPSLAVNGVPVAAVSVPFRVQPASSAVFQPPLRSIPFTPTGED